MILPDKQQRIVTYLGSFSLTRDLRQARLAFHKGVILQSATGDELRRRRTLLPSVLRPYVSSNLSRINLRKANLSRAIREGAVGIGIKKTL